jgi:hypothetical protein
MKVPRQGTRILRKYSFIIICLTKKKIMASKDWMPTSGEAIINMANSWESHLDAIDNLLEVPENARTLLSTKSGTFAGLLATPLSARTPVITAQIKAARTDLVAFMRNFKRRYIFSPPLTDVDLIAMGLRPKDATPTPVGVPVGLVTATVRYVQEGAVELTIRHVEGTPFDPRSNYGTKIRYAVLPSTVTTVENINLLTETRFTRRKKEVFAFSDQDKRNTAWFRLRYENSKGEVGEWGPYVQAIVT